MESDILQQQHSEKVSVMMKRMIHIVLWGLLSVTGSHSAWAAINCTPLPGIPRTDTVTLAPANISAGMDMPDGTVIYQGEWSTILSGTTLGVISCTSNAPSTAQTFYAQVYVGVQSPPKPLSGWIHPQYGNVVYETGIKGIGVMVSFGATEANFDTNFSPLLPVDANSAGRINYNIRRWISLIKIGPLEPGSYPLNGSNLPTMTIGTRWVSGLPVTGLPKVTNIIPFQGVLNISAQTCKSPDVNVDMGSYEKRQYFTGPDSTTPWVDASIILTDCPAFHGYYDSSNLVTLFNYQGSPITPASKNNNLGVRLTPSTPVINSANGIMAIDTTTTNAASGIGIQLGWGNTSGNPALVNFANEQIFQLSKDGRTEIKIPLVARYIQTDVMVTPGMADGKAVFVINYY
ncbi:fimbrial protein [Edaphovirga cremea]|uniref:fimbrial protein n=1 Tax=Edaphovirga cremea TaxID=2267246 RepID=UPI0013004463|nr:fimbrial protein [Edaphovirga cremea]